MEAEEMTMVEVASRSALMLKMQKIGYWVKAVAGVFAVANAICEIVSLESMRQEEVTQW